MNSECFHYSPAPSPSTDGFEAQNTGRGKAEKTSFLMDLNFVSFQRDGQLKASWVTDSHQHQRQETEHAAGVSETADAGRRAERRTRRHCGRGMEASPKQNTKPPSALVPFGNLKGKGRRAVFARQALLT